MIASDEIAITGIGVITPYGDANALQDGLLGCRHCLEPLSIFSTDLDTVPTVGQIHELPSVKDSCAPRLSRTDTLAIIAARRAWENAGLEKSDAAHCGVIVATSVGGICELRPEIAGDPRAYFRKHGIPVEFPRGYAADAVGACLGSGGPRMGISTACASGSMTLAVAARMIRQGSASIMIAGGSEALCWFTLSGFNSLQTLDPEPCRPFDQGRKGLNLGEGAAMLVLESLQHARDRRADVLALIQGWGLSNDAHHLTAPDAMGQGLAASITAAMQMADVQPEDIGYVNAHGTGTYLNDLSEAAAYESVFGHRSRAIPISSSKSYFGHCLGAAGSLEAVVCILSLRNGVVFPTLRLENPVQRVGIEWISGGSQRRQISRALSVSAGFGGSNASLLFGLCA